jgi:SsrA-binding protein
MADPVIRIMAENRKARFEFHILESQECGIVLAGTEVKSLRCGGASLDQSYGFIKNGELYLHGANIAEYAQGNIHNHETQRTRKLLVHKKSLVDWARKVKESGVTIVPLALYFKGSRVKVEMALAKGKKLHDKREGIKEREARRDIDRAMSRRR